VRGGGRFLIWRRRGKIDMVASTARRHRPNRLGGRRIRKNLFARGRLVYGTRRGRVRFVAVTKRRGTLLRRLRATGLR
jgi:hypothetical protein